MSACQNRGCTVDAVAAHWYGIDSQNFIDHVTNYHNRWGREVWVTEFACHNFGGGQQCDNARVWQFMSTVTEWMKRTHFVGKYFPFGVLRDMVGVFEGNRLYNPANDQPTDLGWAYIS